MKNTFKKSAIFLVLTLTVAGCATTLPAAEPISEPAIEAVPTGETAPEPAPTSESVSPSKDETVSLTTYNNQKIGFSIKVPEKVLADYTDEKSLTPLNIFEDDKNVYFTTHSLEETLQNNLWDFKIGGTTLDNRDKVVPFLESYYGVQGCEVEFNKDKNSGFFNLPIFAKDNTLMPDDPFACFIGGKIRTMYDEISGKLITYQLIEQFFFVPGGNVSEESLASLKFTP